MFKLAELEGLEGAPPRYIALEGNLQPLGFEDLERARSNLPLTMELDWRGARVVDTDIPEFDLSQRPNIKATLQSRFTAHAIALVRGGWLPSALATPDPTAIVLLDRNVISEISSRFVGGTRKGRDPDFIDLFATSPIRLSPMLAVLEGAERRPPSGTHARAQLEELTARLRAALPHAEILAGAAQLLGAKGLMAEGQHWFELGQTFLCQIAPLMPGPVARARQPSVWNQILAASDECGLSRKSLVLLAVLSALAAQNGAGPARSILKFKQRYSASDAYNALCDLRSLELFANFLALWPDQAVQLCTADRGLALFWTGLGAHDFRRGGCAAQFDLMFHPGLVPEWATDLWLEATST